MPFWKKKNLTFGSKSITNAYKVMEKIEKLFRRILIQLNSWLHEEMYLNSEVQHLEDLST